MVFDSLLTFYIFLFRHYNNLCINLKNFNLKLFCKTYYSSGEILKLRKFKRMIYKDLTKFSLKIFF